jgi:hypothetical protein
MLQRNANEVADLLEEIGHRAAFEGGNPYKAKAYVRAASSLRRLPRPLGELVEQQALQTIPGIGAAIAKRIENLYRGESDETLERMRRKLPTGLLDILAIPGLKPQTIMKLHDLLGVNSLEDLEAACSNGKVATTKGLVVSAARGSIEPRAPQPISAVPFTAQGGGHAGSWPSPRPLRHDDADEKQHAGDEARHRQGLLQIGRFKSHALPPMT